MVNSPTHERTQRERICRMAKPERNGKVGTTDRAKSLQMALDQIEKSCGRGAIMKLGEVGAQEVECISTGCISIDLALGGKGVPRGRIIEIFGPESSGKTTLALQIVASAQRNGGTAAYIDAEHAVDPSYARKLGVKIDDMLISQPDSGEQALEITEILVHSNAVDVIVIDSVAALVPKAELAGEIGDSFVGVQARMMSQALRRLTSAISKANTTVIFINQLREKIGVMFGSPETTPGGRALKFYSSVRIDIRRVGQIKDGENVVGNRTTAKIVKNKVAPPFQKAEFDIVYNEGISFVGDLIDLGVANGIVQKAGAWFSFGDTRLGQGREGAKQFLRDNPDVATKITDEIRAKVTPAAASAEPDADMDTDEGDPYEGDEEAEAAATPAKSKNNRKSTKSASSSD